MISKQWISWGRNDRREPREKLEGSHDPVFGASIAQLLDAIADAAAWQSSQTVERQWRTGPIAHESLATEVVVSGDDDAGVQVKAIVFNGVAVDGWRRELVDSLLLLGRGLSRSARTAPRCIATTAQASIDVCAGAC